MDFDFIMRQKKDQRLMRNMMKKYYLISEGNIQKTSREVGIDYRTLMKFIVDDRDVDWTPFLKIAKFLQDKRELMVEHNLS